MIGGMLGVESAPPLFPDPAGLHTGGGIANLDDCMIIIKAFFLFYTQLCIIIVLLYICKKKIVLKYAYLHLACEYLSGKSHFHPKNREKPVGAGGGGVLRGKDPPPFQPPWYDKLPPFQHGPTYDLIFSLVRQITPIFPYGVELCK